MTTDQRCEYRIVQECRALNGELSQESGRVIIDSDEKPRLICEDCDRYMVSVMFDIEWIVTA